MSPTTLANFLRHQRQALLSNLPGQFYELKKVVVSNRKTAVTIGVLAVLMGFWIFAKIANRPMESDLSQKRPIPQRMEQMVSLTRLAPIAQLEEFLEEGEDSELPKRFYLSGMKFHSEASELLPGAEKELKLLAKVLLDNPYARTRLEGFTDNGGDPLRMQQLSDERAMAIKNQLVARGVDENQIETAGLGPADSVADNESAEGRAKNNRIEFIVLEK